MHLICSQTHLYSALQKTIKVVPVNSLSQPLTGIHLQAVDTEGGKLILKATDLDFGISISIPAQVIECGQALLPARIFFDLIRCLSPVEITLKTDEENKERVHILTHNCDTLLNGLNPSQYPSIPEIKITYVFQLPRENFQEAIKLVSIAASGEEISNVFSTILVEIKSQDQKINFVATDTHRLAFFTTNLETPIESRNLLIPSRILKEIARLLPPEAEKIRISLGENFIFLEAGNIFLFSRLASGQFPHYQQVLPQSFNTKVELPTRDLQEAIERAILITKEEVKTRSYIIKLQVGDNLNISSQAAEVGVLKERLVATIEGSPLEMIINGRYLLDVLRVFPEDDVKLEFLGPLRPVIIKPVKRKDYFCLILPIKTT